MPKLRSLKQNEYESYTPYGENITVQRVNDASVATTILQVSEVVNLGAGGAGTKGTTKLSKAPIYNAAGTRLGHYISPTNNDTSLTWTTGTCLTTQVQWRHDLSDSEQLADLTEGQYAVNYDTGDIRFCKATAATSDTATYLTRQMNIAITGATDIQIGAVEIKDGTSDNRAAVLSSGVLKTDMSTVNGGTAVATGAGTSTSGTQRVAVARDTRNNVICATHMSPNDGTATYTSGTTITCSGFPFTVDDANCYVVFVQVKPSGGTWGAPYINGMDGVSLSASNNVITISGAGTPFASGDTYRVGLKYQEKAYTSSTNSFRTEEVNPLSVQVVETSLVDTVNLPAGNYYYPSANGMALIGSRDFSLTGKFIDADGTVLLALEGTNDEDTAAGDWINVSLAGFNLQTGNRIASSDLSVTNGTLTYAFNWEKLNLKYIRVKVYVSSSTNTVIVKARRIY